MNYNALCTHYHTICTVMTGLLRFCSVVTDATWPLKLVKAHGPFMDPMLEHSSLVNAHRHFTNKF